MGFPKREIVGPIKDFEAATETLYTKVPFATSSVIVHADHRSKIADLTRWVQAQQTARARSGRRHGLREGNDSRQTKPLAAGLQTGLPTPSAQKTRIRRAPLDCETEAGAPRALVA